MANLPSNVGGRKPTPKKNFSLSDFKKKQNVVDTPNKPLEWYTCSPDMQKATGLPGFPKGYTSLARGFSNTGKSTSICEAAVSAQKMGDLPIFIDTENNIGRERLEKMGFDWGDDAPYIFIDNEYLLREFGKNHDKERSEAAIEDQAEAIHYFLDLQEAGELPFDLCFIIDSLGTLDCVQTIKSHDKGSDSNNMWNAGAFERAFKYILNNRIPSSKKMDKKYTNTIIAVQKIWIDSMGAGVVKHKGGEAYFHGARLIYHFGGIASHGTKKVIAENTKAKVKKTVQYGIQAKVGVVKNQIDGDLGGLAFEGEIISTPHGFIGTAPEDTKKYKNEHLSFFRMALDDDTVNAEDIGTKKITVFKEDEDDVNVFNQQMKDMNTDED